MVKRYELTDIVKVEIPEEVWRAALELSEFLDTKKLSDSHIRLKADRDVIGLLGHWAVDAVLHRWGIPYKSTRKEKYKGGDDYDIEVLGQWLDVKSMSYGIYSEKYFYNLDFYLLKPKIDDEKQGSINAYVIVHIELDSNRVPMRARIFGTITREELLRCPVIGPSERPKLKYENYHLKSRQLKSLYNYIYRT